MSELTVSVTWSKTEAWSFAQFLKRVGYSDYRLLAASETEAFQMQDAGERLRSALAEKGMAPR